MTWALESLKNFHFNGLLLSKVYIVWAKKVQRSNLSWNWRGIQNLERYWLIISKLAQGIWQNLTRALESLKKIHFNGSFWAKYILFELKKYRGIIFHETEEGYTICWGIDLPFQNWHKKFDKFWPEHSEVSKIFILMGPLWVQYILFELKKNRGVFFHETGRGIKIWTLIDSSFQN